jgi:Domain of unknown function (DUF4367)
MPKAKNNLSTFDIDQIEADLMAVEAETLSLDSREVGSEIKKDNKASTEKTSSAYSERFKPHPVNVVNFNPDNSKLLHKVLRDGTPAPKPTAQPKASNDARANSTGEDVAKKAQPLRVVTVSKVSGGASMDGFKKPRQTAKATRPEPVAAENTDIKSDSVANSSSSPTRPVNLTSVALTGMQRANQFNRYALEQHKTSLHNQVEKQSLFERSLDGDVEVYDKGLQTNGGKKVYNVGRRKSMLGGVDQHNIGPGRVRRALGYRPMKFLMPVFAFLFVGTYVMYMNLPSINIKVAENRSGVAISEPSYTPDGYRLSGQIEADTGQVAMSFKNGSEAFNVSQKVSDWDSRALLENKILKETAEYSAYTDRGLTIYVYDGKAVWVNQGKVFEIKLDGSQLDTEELIRIAGSM